MSRIPRDQDAKVTNHTPNFSFIDPHYPTSISGPVSLLITDYTNIEVYNQSFDAHDTALQNLKIVADLRRPPITTGGINQDGSVASSGKRIRGQIVSLTKNCTLKGSVIFQAKGKNHRSVDDSING